MLSPALPVRCAKTFLTVQLMYPIFLNCSISHKFHPEHLNKYILSLIHSPYQMHHSFCGGEVWLVITPWSPIFRSARFNFAQELTSFACTLFHCGTTVLDHRTIGELTDHKKTCLPCFMCLLFNCGTLDRFRFPTQESTSMFSEIR